MSRDFDDIYKKIDQSHKELYKQDQDKILREISDIKREIKNIGFKVDTMLDILNNFTILLAEDEGMEEDYDDNESWVPPEQDEDWNNYDDDDEEDERWLV